MQAFLRVLLFDGHKGMDHPTGISQPQGKNAVGAGQGKGAAGNVTADTFKHTKAGVAGKVVEAIVFFQISSSLLGE